MRICFNAASVWMAAVIIFLTPASTLAAGLQPPQVRSVVRADAKTGRLIRSFALTRSSVFQRPEGGRMKIADAAPGASVAEIVDEMAKKYDVDPLLVHSVIQVESAYDPYAVSSKGAQGLMQLMPDTARRFGVTNTFDVRDNIEGGVRYLKYLDTLFPDDLNLKLAAYNAGEGAVWKYNNKVPPYRETRQYVYKVGARFNQALKAASSKKAVQKPQSAVDTSSMTAENYAPVLSYLDAEGRLYLRTAETSGNGKDTVRTP